MNSRQKKWKEDERPRNAMCVYSLVQLNESIKATAKKNESNNNNPTTIIKLFRIRILRKKRMNDFEKPINF